MRNRVGRIFGRNEFSEIRTQKRGSVKASTHITALNCGSTGNKKKPPIRNSHPTIRVGFTFTAATMYNKYEYENGYIRKNGNVNTKLGIH